jgi:hypothetical protein
MNPIADKINNLILQYEELEKLNVLSNKNLSDIDTELSSCYHRIEGTVIKHVSQSHKLIKELKIILEKRRIIKLEGLLLRSTCDLLRDKVGQVKGTNKKTLSKHIEVKQEILDKAK